MIPEQQQHCLYRQILLLKFLTQPAKPNILMRAPVHCTGSRLEKSDGSLVAAWWQIFFPLSFQVLRFLHQGCCCPLLDNLLSVSQKCVAIDGDAESHTGRLEPNRKSTRWFEHSECFVSQMAARPPPLHAGRMARFAMADVADVDVIHRRRC